MRFEILVQTLADLVVAIELADEDQISPEAASELYDLVAASLHRLNEQEKVDLVMMLEKLAALEKDSARAALLANLPGGLGLMVD